MTKNTMNCVDYLFEHSQQFKKNLILGPTEQISYDKTWKSVLSLADYLHKEFGQDNKIILIGNNSVFFILSYLAIMKSGNVCVPLNPSVSDTVLQYVVKTCQPPIAFTDEISENRINSLGLNTLTEDSVEPILKQTDVQRSTAFPVVSGDSIAEILFTSGSTALPKGVMLSHRNIIANTESIIEYLQLTKRDIMEVVLPFSYCYGLSLLHTHIRVGGSLVLNNKFIFINTVINDLKKYKCTGFAGVPSHFQIMLRKSETFKTTNFPDLRYVTQAGGKLAKPFIQEFTESFPEVKFFVMYGQTEATARLSYLPPERLPDKLDSIGQGIPGVELEVLDKSGNPVQPGEPGEIVASGDNIMQGYLNEPQLTKQMLRENKLRTGDIATVDEDGFIYIIGREREFLKVGGERISPKEVEQVIVSLPEIVDCSVVGVDDDILGEAIKALVVLRDGENSGTIQEKIHQNCLEQLGMQKVPKYYEFLDRIPMNDSGKKTQAAIRDVLNAS